MLSGRFRRERFTAGPRRGGKGDKSEYCELVLEDEQFLSPFLFAMVKKPTGYSCTVFTGAQKQRCEWLSRFIAFHGLGLLS